MLDGLAPRKRPKRPQSIAQYASISEIAMNRTAGLCPMRSDCRGGGQVEVQPIIPFFSTNLWVVAVANIFALVAGLWALGKVAIAISRFVRDWWTGSFRSARRRWKYRRAAYILIMASDTAIFLATLIRTASALVAYTGLAVMLMVTNFGMGERLGPTFRLIVKISVMVNSVLILYFLALVLSLSRDVIRRRATWLGRIRPFPVGLD